MVPQKKEKADTFKVMNEIAEQSREWTQNVVTRYKRCGHKNRVSYIMGDYRHDKWKRPHMSGPVFSHALLETRRQNTSEPGGRSCLTGFELLMRHVGLWEMAINKKIK